MNFLPSSNYSNPGVLKLVNYERYFCLPKPESLPKSFILSSFTVKPGTARYAFPGFAGEGFITLIWPMMWGQLLGSWKQSLLVDKGEAGGRNCLTSSLAFCSWIWCEDVMWCVGFCNHLEMMRGNLGTQSLIIFFMKRINNSFFKTLLVRGLPGSPVVKNLPASAEDMGLIPGPGRFHRLWSN